MQRSSMTGCCTRAATQRAVPRLAVTAPGASVRSPVFSSAGRARGRQLQLQVVLHGHPHGGTKFDANAEKNKGFVNEMRMVAMKLHTRDQAPKEGGQPAVQRTWQPTREGYVRFLSESKAVYDVLERIIAEGRRPEYIQLQGSGLERSAALVRDLQWFESEYGIKAPAVEPHGPGAEYAAKLEELATSDPQSFICHYYNFYFAHTAGGRMIGSKVAQMLLDNKQLDFYKYDGDVQVLLDAVRKKINALSEGWSREQKDRCLAETAASFKYSGVILNCINSAA